MIAQSCSTSESCKDYVTLLSTHGGIYGQSFVSCKYLYSFFIIYYIILNIFLEFSSMLKMVTNTIAKGTITFSVLQISNSAKLVGYT